MLLQRKLHRIEVPLSMPSVLLWYKVTDYRPFRFQDLFLIYSSIIQSGEMHGKGRRVSERVGERTEREGWERL